MYFETSLYFSRIYFKSNDKIMKTFSRVDTEMESESLNHIRFPTVNHMREFNVQCCRATTTESSSST